MSKRLYIDHENAQTLATAMNYIDGIIVDPKSVHTNIIYADLQPDILHMNAKTFIDELNRVHGVRGLVVTSTKVRFVLNYHVTREDVEYTVKAILAVVEKHKI